LIKDNILTIIPPVKIAKQFSLTLQPKWNLANEFQIYYDEKPLKTTRKDLIDATIAYYQTSAKLLKEKKYQK
jgi:hypothetical protein